MDQIIIKQDYFDNIKTAVDSINQFFESGFSVKNFPTNNENLDWAINNVVELMEDLDPVYVSDNTKMAEVVEDIHTKLEDNPDKSTDEILSDRQMNSALSAIVSYSSLQQIADHFDEFSKFINGIYTFELFMKPSQYKNEIQMFSSAVDLPYELEDLDLDVSLFAVDTYVSNLMNNPDVKFPDTINVDAQIQRMLNFQDIKNTEVVVDNTPKANIAESALSDFIISSNNVRYNKEADRFQISKQFASWVDWFTESLHACETTSDLVDFFSKHSSINTKYQDFCMPFIVAETYTNPEKCSLYLSGHEYIPPTCEYMCDRIYDEARENSDKPYAEYDLFDAFKIDKEATIQFLDDYFRLKFVNESNCAIHNSLLADMFLEYDASPYFQSLYYLKNRTACADTVKAFV